MAGGTLTITVPNYGMLQQVAQRITCWAGGPGNFQNNALIQLRSTTQVPAFIIPESLFAIGALVLEPGGADLLSGYVAGTHITFNANNGLAASQDPNTCPAIGAEPVIINSFATNVGGNPLAITMNYANFAGNGTVNVTWGDGTTTAGAAESNAALAHTYPYQPGNFTVRVTDASVPTVWTETTITIP